MSTKKELKEKCRMITPKFRVSYPHLFKAQSPKPGDKPKYSVTMLLPKNANLTGSTLATDDVPAREISIKEVIRNAKIAEFGPDKANWPELDSPVVDGDDPDHIGKDGYKGHWIIKATSNEDAKPGLVDAEGLPITQTSDFYPGCYARAYVYAYVWFYPNREKPMKKGVGFIVDHVQKLADGKAFGGKKPVEQVFGPVGTGSADDDDDSEENFI